MIRPLTLVCALMAAGSGLYLYETKHAAQLLDRQIRQVREATDATLAHAGLLRTEYALLNDPERLGGLTAQYLPDLRSTQPQQWTSMTELDRRLPPVGAPTAEPSPLEPEAAPVAQPAAAPPLRPVQAIAAAAPRPVPVAARVAVARAASRPIALAARMPQPQAIVLASVPAVRSPAATQVQLARASTAPPVVLRVSLPAAAAYAGQGTRVYAAAARPAAQPFLYVAPPATAAEAVNRIAHGGLIDPSVPVVASALGMARTLLTVTPVSSASAATFYPAVTTR